MKQILYTTTLEKNSFDAFLPPISNGYVRFGRKVSPVKIVWDTGSTNTSISYWTAHDLEIHGNGAEIEVGHVGGKSKEPLCTVGIYVNDNGFHFGNNMVVSIRPKKDETRNVLLGMDIISQFDFLLRHDNDKIIFEFYMEV